MCKKQASLAAKVGKRRKRTFSALGANRTKICFYQFPIQVAKTERL